MVRFVLHRLLAGAFVVALTALVAYGGWRSLRSPLPENHRWLEKTLGDLRGLLHGDFGTACSYLTGAKSRPCPSIRALFERGWQADV